MHDLGAATVGASTLPEQIACYLSGMRRIIVSSATSPSSGMSSAEISGEEVLECGRKCVLSFAKLLPVLISKLRDDMFQNKRPNILLNQLSNKDKLDNRRVSFNQRHQRYRLIDMILMNLERGFRKLL